LTSPPLAVQRRFLNFLIGGGGYAGETCIDLLLDGRVVRTATGPNVQPGGSEQLEWYSWDVGDLAGKEVVVRIVDRRTGGWGHINVDHIVQSNRSMMVPPEDLVRSIELHKDYLNLPRPFRGKVAELRVNALVPGSGGLKIVDQTDEIKGADSLYDEPLRPQFHFSQKRGWNNDPNGMLYHDGEYHLFFQHNPYGWRWANMHWGHAVSKDLVHWEELPTALFPWTQAVAHCFSGSAVVDARNTAGFQSGDEKTIVAAFTDTGCGEAIAYSNDRGRTFTYYEGNPVVKHKGRDPKVIWYEPGGHWVMAVYTEQDASRAIAFYTSPNLKDWEYQSRLDGFYECPELFELPVDGDPANTRWVVFAADAKYVLGRFDGKTFTPEHEGKHQVHWGAYYASQLFTGAPEGRHIQIGWGRINMDGMPFNQMMTFPCELALRTTDEGIRMLAAPVKEIELLHQRKHALQTVQVQPGEPVTVPTRGRLFDIRAEFEVGQASVFGLQIGDTRVTYDAAKADLMGMPLKPVEGKIRIQILVDRPSMEICGNDGRVYQTRAFRSEDEIEAIQVFAEGQPVQLNRLEIHELKSIW
jgi:fructan beta-fructosidase